MQGPASRCDPIRAPLDETDHVEVTLRQRVQRRCRVNSELIDGPKSIRICPDVKSGRDDPRPRLVVAKSAAIAEELQEAASAAPVV